MEPEVRLSRGDVDYAGGDTVTVAELIAKLREFPGTMEIQMDAGQDAGVVPVVGVTLHKTEWQSDPKCNVHGFVPEAQWRGGKYGVCRLCHPDDQRVNLDSGNGMLKMERHAVALDDQVLVIDWQVQP